MALKRTPLYDLHVAAGARMVDFVGWEMPILYTSIVAEHQQTRTSGGLFDVSHMGRLAVAGRDALKLLDLAVTRDLSKCEVGQCKYGLVCDAAGKTMDDVIVGRGEDDWTFVCNASNRDKIVRHLDQLKRDRGLSATIDDRTEATAMVALQGPKTVAMVAETLGEAVSDLKRYRFLSDSMFFVDYSVFRTGYTGEDGVEVVFPARAASMVVKRLAGKLDDTDSPIKPAGLGARDTLRLEAGMPLYGHELTPETDPIAAGLGWAVDLGKEFVGAEALRKISADGPPRKLVGLTLAGRRIARQGASVVLGDQTVGVVTSGTFGPTVNASIAMAYVDAAHAAEGTPLAVDFRGTAEPATVTKLPFYKKPKA